MNTTVQSLRSTVDYSRPQTREADRPLLHDDAKLTTDALATRVFAYTIAYAVIFVIAAVLLVA